MFLKVFYPFCVTAERSGTQLLQSASLEEEFRSSSNVFLTALLSLRRFDFVYRSQVNGFNQAKKLYFSKPLRALDIFTVPFPDVFWDFLHYFSSNYIFSLKSQIVSVQFLKQIINKCFFIVNKYRISYSKINRSFAAVILEGAKGANIARDILEKDFQN